MGWRKVPGHFNTNIVAPKKIEYKVAVFLVLIGFPLIQVLKRSLVRALLNLVLQRTDIYENSYSYYSEQPIHCRSFIGAEQNLKQFFHVT